MSRSKVSLCLCVEREMLVWFVSCIFLVWTWTVRTQLLTIKLLIYDKLMIHAWVQDLKTLAPWNIMGAGQFKHS